jgi:hypothetical protein
MRIVNGCQEPVVEFRTRRFELALTWAICAAGRLSITSTWPPRSALTRAVSSEKSMITT